MGEFGGRGGFNRGPRQEFDAVCAACGKACKVPFEPKAGRDVFCRECFAERRKSSGHEY